MTLRSPIRPRQSSAEGRANVLQGLLIAVIVIGGLYFAQEILLPLAVAILLSFVLTPPLLVLQRIKVPRVIAVVIVVGVAFSILGGLGWLVSREATKLAIDLPNYRFTLSQKIQLLRETTAESQVLKKAGDVLQDLEAELDQPDTADTTPPGVAKPEQEAQPIPVEIRVPEPTGLDFYRSVAGTVLPPLITAGVILLFVVFILLQREDLRDRLIRLFGASDLQRATATMSEAATRLSQFFLRQVLVNATYGVLIGVALWAIGMPSAIAWGILAMVMRFVPYVGSYIAAALPVLIAAAIDPGWTMVLMVIALYVVGEFTMGQVVEPLVYGRGTGVTPIAVIGATVFWTWLWGPLGLLIATPMTVCLAVLGRHVDGLSFFDVLLGDRPALSPQQSFYRHALVGGASDATYQAELALKDQSLLTYLDEVALAGLAFAERDRARGTLEDEQGERIADTVAEILDNLDTYEPKRWFARLRRKLDNGDGDSETDHLPADEPEAEDAHMVDPGKLAPGWDDGTPIVCIGARSNLDKAAALMLAQLLVKRGIEAEALPPSAIAAGNIETLATTTAKMVCLSYLGFGSGLVQIRYAVRRLRRILPENTLILVAYWQSEGEVGDAAKLLDAVEADAYASTLHEAVKICEQAATGELAPRDGGEKAKSRPGAPAPAGKATSAAARRLGPAPA